MNPYDRFRHRFEQAPNTRERGQLAENEAVRWLRRRGYRILERNYRTRVGEIDIVARVDHTLCFIEVKARTRSDYGPAVLAVDRKRRARLVRAATLYLGSHGGEDQRCRFDVLALDQGREGWEIRLYEGAFEAE